MSPHSPTFPLIRACSFFICGQFFSASSLEQGFFFNFFFFTGTYLVVIFLHMTLNSVRYQPRPQTTRSIWERRTKFSCRFSHRDRFCCGPSFVCTFSQRDWSRTELTCTKLVVKCGDRHVKPFYQSSET